MCVKFSVDVFPVERINDDTGNVSNSGITNQDGCDKMSLCGIVEQTKTIHFQIVDNRKREDADVEVLVHLDFETFVLDVHQSQEHPYTYELDWKRNTG